MPGEANVAKAGLEGIVAAQSRISDVNGDEGTLIYSGYDIHDLAEHSTFEEIVYLLWNGELPTRAALEELKKQLNADTGLPAGIIDLINAIPKTASPMDMLRTVVSALALYDPDGGDMSTEANQRKAIRLTAKFPTIVTTFQRVRNGQKPVEPRKDLSIAGNFLFTLRGEAPDEVSTRTMDVALILHADHELNASTFAARVTAATLSDMYSAIVSAIGTLKGPLHGGANEQVMLMVEQIGAPAKAEAWIRKALADKVRVMGFGHRVYRVADPRARHLRRLATELGQKAGNTSYVEILDIVARVVTEGKHIFPNVDLYSGAAYKSMGIPTDQFTPIFALSRVAGWAAHVMDQHANNRLIRPRAEYTGPTHATYVPIDRRYGGRPRRADREP